VICFVVDRVLAVRYVLLLIMYLQCDMFCYWPYTCNV